MSEKDEIKKKEKRVRKFKKNIKHNINMFLLFSAVVMIWWAIWGFFDIFFPYNSDYRLVGYVVMLVFGIVIVYLEEYDLEEVV